MKKSKNVIELLICLSLMMTFNSLNASSLDYEFPSFAKCMKVICLAVTSVMTISNSDAYLLNKNPVSNEYGHLNSARNIFNSRLLIPQQTYSKTPTCFGSLTTFGSDDNDNEDDFLSEYLRRKKQKYVDKSNPLKKWEEVNITLRDISERLYTDICAGIPSPLNAKKFYKENKKLQKMYADRFFEALSYNEKTSREQSISNVLHILIVERRLGGKAINVFRKSLPIIPPKTLEDPHFLSVLLKLSNDDIPESIEYYIDFMLTSYEDAFDYF